MNDIQALFQPVRIGPLELPNRIVMAPMTRSFCGEAGIPGSDVANYYAARAAGGTGLIFTEATVVDMGPARGYLGVPGICNDAQEAAWRAVVEAVHAQGGRIMVQLWHCGRLAHPRATGGAQPIAPSPLVAPPPYVDLSDPSTYDGHLSYVEPREMTSGDITGVTDEFAQAARRAHKAGFDGILFHGASGYLIHEFYNADSNRRTDDYGGSVAARARFACELISAAREATDADFPLLMGLGQFAVDDYDWVTWPNPAELAETLNALARAGINGFHVAAHRIDKPAFASQEDASGKGLAWHVRQLSGLPTVAVGGVTYSTPLQESLMGDECQLSDPAEAAAFIDQGDADLIAVGRAMIANPGWAKQVLEGRWQELKPFGRELLMTLV